MVSTPAPAPPASAERTARDVRRVTGDDWWRIEAAALAAEPSMLVRFNRQVVPERLLTLFRAPAGTRLRHGLARSLILTSFRSCVPLIAGRRLPKQSQRPFADAEDWQIAALNELQAAGERLPHGRREAIREDIARAVAVLRNRGLIDDALACQAAEAPLGLLGWTLGTRTHGCDPHAGST